METFILERTVKKGPSFDVIVAGGGIAGVSAAVAAARAGVSVLLTEKSVCLGGLATNGLISWYEPLCDGQGKQMIFGISEELIRLSARCGFNDLPAEWGGEERPGNRRHRFATHFSPTLFSAALDSFVKDSGVRLRFDTLATHPLVENGICSGVVVESVNGAEFFGAKFVIDATGDASVMDRAGVPTVEGHNYLTYVAHMFTEESAGKYASDRDICRFRHWINSGSDLYGRGHPEGVKRITGTDADENTEFVISGRKRLIDRLSNLEKGSFDIMALPSMPQLRTVRRIVGNTDFCAVDGQTFPDSIGTCGDFRPTGIGKHYQIPLGSLWNSAFPNMLAAGRIISAPEGDGWEASRVIPVCALTGEAAGKAAALCLKKGIDLRGVGAGEVEKIAVN